MFPVTESGSGARPGPDPHRILVVMGCRVSPERLSSAAARRCQRAANAWFEGGFDRVIVSGGKRWGHVTEAEQMAARLFELGVPATVIVQEQLSLNTYENAYFSARILKHFSASSVSVVSCAFHLPRALREFQRQGWTVSGLAAAPALGSYASPPRRAWWERGAWSQRAMERVRGWVQAPLHPFWSL